MKMITPILNGYIPSTLLANDLNIESKDFKDTTLEKIVFKKVTLVKIPNEAVKYAESTEYISCRLKADESESSYAYVLKISNKVRVGFWK